MSGARNIGNTLPRRVDFLLDLSFGRAENAGIGSGRITQLNRFAASLVGSIFSVRVDF